MTTPFEIDLEKDPVVIRRNYVFGPPKKLVTEPLVELVIERARSKKEELGWAYSNSLTIAMARACGVAVRYVDPPPRTPPWWDFMDA